jgi:excisionase family DNA binding protein
MRSSRSSLFLRPRSYSSADAACARDASTTVLGVPGSSILAADVPFWAAEISPEDRPQTVARRRPEQWDPSGANSSRHRDAAVVKERLPVAKQGIVARRASRLEPLLTVNETAAILNVSERTVRRLVAAGAIPVVSIGRSVRLRPRDINQLIADGGVCND